jgi:hypothetical protein
VAGISEEDEAKLPDLEVKIETFSQEIDNNLRFLFSSPTGISYHGVITHQLKRDIGNYFVVSTGHYTFG